MFLDGTIHFSQDFDETPKKEVFVFFFSSFLFFSPRPFTDSLSIGLELSSFEKSRLFPATPFLQRFY